ncbi:MAG: hypothetical protein H0W70_10075, partial [Actinobacteria bacterium]|nr:hypothetical protein [Actinomycetota bacterium]
MSHIQEAVLRKVIALGTAAMLVASLSAIAVVRADHRNAPTRLASGGRTANGLQGLDEGAGAA